MNSDIRCNLVVIRHGESDANKNGIISDKTVDHPLTERGIAQAGHTAKDLKAERFELVVSSSRKRALDTAQIVNKFHYYYCTLVSII